MLYRDGYMSVGIAESAELSCRPTVVVKHADNVIDQALHLLQGEANAVPEATALRSELPLYFMDGFVAISV